MPNIVVKSSKSKFLQEMITMSQAMKRLTLFCAVDDFCSVFIPLWNMTLIQYGVIRRVREPQLSISEMMTIIIHFHQSHYRDFKTYYLEYVCEYLRGEFPRLVSYNRFIELMPRTLLPLCCSENSAQLVTWTFWG
jgi:hypothetical protein